MERNREVRRGNTPAMNGNGGGGVSRRKQRSNVIRDYPDDAATEMHETPRLRDRGAKKDRERDRDRFSRSKRRRIFHGDDAEESSEESLDDEVDEDETAVRHPPMNHAAPPAPAQAQSHQHHSDRKGLASRMPPWDEMNLSVPRKARSKSATVKRMHEPWSSAGGGSGGGGAENQRQFSISPSRLSPSASQISSNSNKMKSLGGTKKKKQQASSTAEELEVAELLTVLRTKEECSIRIDKIDDNGMNNDVKSSIRSPSSISQPAVQPQPDNLGSNPLLTAVAPKRKRPRQVTTLLGQPSILASSSDKLIVDQPAQHDEACLPKFDMLAPSPAIENGGKSHEFSSLQPISTPIVKQEHENLVREEVKEEVSLPEKEIPPANVDKAMAEQISPVAKNLRKEKFTIDLMAPPEKSSPERDSLCDFGSEDTPVVQEFKPVSEITDESNEVIRKFAKNGFGGLMNGGEAEKSVIEDFESKKQPKGKAIDIPIDLENADNMDIIKHDMPKQQSTSSRADTQSDKTVPTSLSIPTTMTGWPGSFPQFGYMPQVPSLPSIMSSMDAATGSSSIRQLPPNLPPPPVKRNRCSKHLYIAQSIQYNQKIMQANPFWQAGAAQLFVPKPPANVRPPLDPILGNPLQGGVPGRSLGSLQDTKVAPYFAAFTGQPSNASISNANIAEAVHRTQLGLPQMPPQHPGLPSNMIPSPALFYPINQHQAMAAAAAAAAVRSGAAKSSTGVGSVAPSSGVSSSAVANSGGGGAAVAMNLGYSTEQYLAILQNSGYPIPLPAHLGGPSAYRGGTNPSPAMPQFSVPFYQSQMLHHSQLQPTSESTPQKPPHTQPGLPNTNTNPSTSTGSSSSQKQQLQRVAGGGSNDAGTSSHGLPSQKQHHSRSIENEAGGEDGPSSSDSRVLQAQKSLYAHNMAMSIQSQNAAMLSTAATASALKHTQQQQPVMKGDLTPSQAFAMSCAPNNGSASLSSMNYSSMAQGHALFQNLPDITRQGYQMNMAAAAAAAEAPMSAQQKKAHSHSQAMESGKSVESVLKSSGICGLQHLPSYAKPDNERPTNTSHGNSVVESSSGAANSTVRISNQSTNAAIGPTNTATLTTPNFQLHRAQELQMQRLASVAKSTSSNNAGAYSGAATTLKFPQTVSGFSHGPTQSGSPTQAQWKTSGRASTPTPTATADQFTSRNQQLRSGLTSSHQANISFSANSMKSSLAGAHAGGSTANVYVSSTAGAPAAPSHGSPSNSFSKSNGGSPRASASENQTTPSNAAAPSPQSYPNSSTSSSSRKSPPTENIPTNPSHTQKQLQRMQQQKQLQQMQQQYRMQSQQPTQKQAQFFFNGTGSYMQAQAAQSGSAAASVFYRQQLDHQQPSHQQQHQKQSLNPAAAGLTLTSSSGVSDPSKVGGAGSSNSTKGMPPPGLLHSAHMAAAASGTAHPLMSAMFPYMSMPSAKPGDQKPATGNDNLNASWQPEKRS